MTAHGLGPNVRAMSEGRFITFEGGDGVGKTTQIARLADRLDAAGQGYLITREPGGTPFAERLRELILARETPEHSALSEALLFLSARHDHVERTIRPALEQGDWVLCDRFADSTRAYQGAAGGVDLETLKALEEIVHPCCRPDLTIILDLDPLSGVARRARRRDEAGGDLTQADRYEVRDQAFQERLRQAFLSISADEPERCRVVDAGQGIDAVHGDIWRVIRERFEDEVA